jgi:hypothetical protein
MEKSIDQLINELVNYLIERGKTIDIGDYKTGNKLFTKIKKVANLLEQQGIPGKEAIAHLMKHENSYVRCWAALHSLRYKTEEAERILKDLVDSKEIAGIDARMYLDIWKRESFIIPDNW